MKILGVDPGLRITGYGVIDLDLSGRAGDQSRIRLIEAGVIRTATGTSISQRLEKIFCSLSAVIEELKPEVLAMEKLYAHYAHPATAILMGHARGVVCLLSGIYDISLVSIASTHVKKAVTGRGHAGKLQVQRMIQHELGLKSLPEPPDVADALAIALAYVSSLKRKS